MCRVRRAGVTRVWRADLREGCGQALSWRSQLPACLALRLALAHPWDMLIRSWHVAERRIRPCNWWDHGRKDDRLGCALYLCVLGTLSNLRYYYTGRLRKPRLCISLTFRDDGRRGVCCSGIVAGAVDGCLSLCYRWQFVACTHHVSRLLHRVRRLAELESLKVWIGESCRPVVGVAHSAWLRAFDFCYRRLSKIMWISWYSVRLRAFDHSFLESREMCRLSWRADSFELAILTGAKCTASSSFLAWCRTVHRLNWSIWNWSVVMPRRQMEHLLLSHDWTSIDLLPWAISSRLGQPTILLRFVHLAL